MLRFDVSLAAVLENGVARKYVPLYRCTTKLFFISEDTRLKLVVKLLDLKIDTGL